MRAPDVAAARARGFEVIDPHARSWVPVPAGSDFPLHNLPLGVCRVGGGPPRVAAAIGEHVVDLHAVAEAGLLDDAVADARGVLGHDTLNPLLARGRPTWAALRRALVALLSVDGTGSDALGAGMLHHRREVTSQLPFAVGDYVDFFSSQEHARNVGRILRPGDDPLPANWRHLPVAYHGRASTVVVSGTPVARPAGQGAPDEIGRPRFGPTQMLDFELEVGFVTGPGNAPGRPIAADDAAEHIFGLVLVNDWSARDIQAWESRPLGPFLGKSFATTVSPWVVPLDALAPWLVSPPLQDPPVLDYLRTNRPWALDLHLEAAVTPAGGSPTTVTRTNFAHLYWTMAQQLAHVTVNGTALRPGDLYASGTVSGPDPASYGSLLERTWRGEQPLTLNDGKVRTFLADGDTVVLRGWCGDGHAVRVGFGAAAGQVRPTAIS